MPRVRRRRGRARTRRPTACRPTFRFARRSRTGPDVKPPACPRLRPAGARPIRSSTSPRSGSRGNGHRPLGAPRELWAPPARCRARAPRQAAGRAGMEAPRKLPTVMRRSPSAPRPTRAGSRRPGPRRHRPGNSRVASPCRVRGRRHRPGPPARPGPPLAGRSPMTRSRRRRSATRDSDDDEDAEFRPQAPPGHCSRGRCPECDGRGTRAASDHRRLEGVVGTRRLARRRFGAGVAFSSERAPAARP